MESFSTGSSNPGSNRSLPAPAAIVRHRTATRTEPRELLQLSSLKLQKGEKQNVHAASAETRLQARLWVGGSSFEQCKLHGVFTFQRPAHHSHQSLWCTIYPPTEGGAHATRPRSHHATRPRPMRTPRRAPRATRRRHP
eukprot:6784723-Prymnesium_polylepis.1